MTSSQHEMTIRFVTTHDGDITSSDVARFLSVIVGRFIQQPRFVEENASTHFYDQKYIDNISVIESNIGPVVSQEVPGEIRRRRGLITSIASSYGDMMKWWNNTARRMHVYTDQKSDINTRNMDFVKSNRGLILSVDDVDDYRGLYNRSYSVLFPEIDEKRALEMWSNVVSRLHEAYNAAYESIVLDEIARSLDSDFEDGLTEEMRNEQISNGLKAMFNDHDDAVKNGTAVEVNSYFGSHNSADSAIF